MGPGDVSPGRWGRLPQVKRPPGGEVCTWWVLDLPGCVQMTSKSQWSVGRAKGPGFTAKHRKPTYGPCIFSLKKAVLFLL